MAFPVGVKAYWKLEDVSDVTGVYPLTNTGTTTFSAGKINNAANFGDANSTKSLKNESIHTTAYPITVSMWIKPKVVNGNDYFFSLADDTVHYYGMKLRDTDSHIVFRSNNDTEAADVDTGIVASVDTWYHVVCNIIDTTHVTLYVNGTATNTNSSIYVASGLDRFILGALGRSTPVEHYSGLIDEVGYWGRSLTQDEVTALYNSGNGASDYLTLSVVSYYKLDESSGNAADSVGSNTLTNNGSATYSAGKINNGVDLELSSSQSLSIADNASLSITGDLSISCWVKLESSPSAGNFETLVSKFVFTTANRSYVLLYRNTGGTYSLEFINSSNGTAESVCNKTQTLTEGTWYHIVVTQASGTATIYVNGSSIGTGAVNNGQYDSTAPFEIGSLNGGNFYFDGMIDEVGIWSRAISSTEVTELYNSGNGLQYPFILGVTVTISSPLSSTFSSLTPVIQIEGLKNNIVSYYKMEGNSNDSVGTKNGTDTSISYNALYGKISQGASLNGIDSKILLPNTAKGGDSFSVAAWVYNNASGTSTVYSESADKNANIEIVSGGILRLHLKTSAAPYAYYDSNNNVVPAGRWNHIVRAYNSVTGILKGFVNGVEVINTYVGGNQSYTAGTNENIIGCYRASATDSGFFNGNIDEFGMWERALTQDEAELLYNDNLGNTYDFTSITVAPSVLTARFSILGVNLISKGVSSMRSRGTRYKLYMEDKSII